MKFRLLTLGLVAAAAGAVGGACYCLGGDPALRSAAARHDAMAWLRSDFHLTDAQAGAIGKLHAAYAPACDEHCRLVREAIQARDALRSARADDAAALAAAEQKVRELHATCEAALNEQVRSVAALMSPEDGRRYLALLLPMIAGYGHAGAPDLHLHAP